MEEPWQKSQAPKNKIVNEIKNTIDIRGKNILEMGAGSGLTSLELARLKAEVTVCDLSWDSVKLMLENFKGYNTKIIQADVFNLPFKNASFEVVFHQGLIEHFENPEKILKEQIRVLKKDGAFLIEVPQKFSTYTLMKHRHIKLGEWYAGWETEYSIFTLKKLIRHIKGYKLKIISSFGYGTWGVLTRIRYLHYRGNVRFGHPLLPKPVFSIYEFIWRIIENSFLMKLIGVNICIVGIKK